MRPVGATAPPPARRRPGPFVAFGLLVAVVLAAGVSRWASSEPDGLERVAADHGLDVDATTVVEGPLAEYRTPGLADPATSTGGAGLIGVGVTFALAGGAVTTSSPR